MVLLDSSSLPYTVAILLIEISVGGVGVLSYFAWRGQITSGYVKAGSITITPLACLAFLTFRTISEQGNVGDYLLDLNWIKTTNFTFLAIFICSLFYLLAAMLDKYRWVYYLGLLLTISGFFCLVSIAMLLAPPVWSVFGAVASVIIGALVCGSSLMAMMWGHWYLTSGQVPKEPMIQMAILVIGALLLQTVLVCCGALITPRIEPINQSLIIVDLSQNPAFWLRITVGLFFPLILSVLAWRTAQIRGMMSSTGLLYLVLGTVLVGEVLARGLLFTTSRIV